MPTKLFSVQITRTYGTTMLIENLLVFLALDILEMLSAYVTIPF